MMLIIIFSTNEFSWKDTIYYREEFMLMMECHLGKWWMQKRSPKNILQYYRR